MPGLKITEVTDTLAGDTLVLYAGAFDDMTAFIKEHGLQDIMSNEIVEITTPIGEDWRPGVLIYSDDSAKLIMFMDLSFAGY